MRLLAGHLSPSFGSGYSYAYVEEKDSSIFRRSHCKKMNRSCGHPHDKSDIRIVSGCRIHLSIPQFKGPFGDDSQIHFVQKHHPVVTIRWGHDQLHPDESNTWGARPNDLKGYTSMTGTVSIPRKLWTKTFIPISLC